jgi:uncharacterized membrane protein HdeD (DUF308 family)
MVERVSAYLMKGFGLSEPEARRRAMELLSTLSEDEGHEVTHRWWAFLMRGLLSVGIGMLFLFRPGPALLLVILTFGVWVFVDGLLSIGSAVEGHGPTGSLWLSGVLGIAVGILTLARPGVTATFLYLAVGIWAIVRGISELSAGVQGRKVPAGEGWIVVSGLLSIGLGLLIILQPHIGAPLLAWLIGLYALADGLVLVGLSMRIRRVGEVLEGVRAHFRRPEPRPT